MGNFADDTRIYLRDICTEVVMTIPEGDLHI